MTDEPKHGPVGRPARPMPEKIPQTRPIARAIMQGPPAKEWDFLKDKIEENEE